MFTGHHAKIIYEPFLFYVSPQFRSLIYNSVENENQKCLVLYLRTNSNKNHDLSPHLYVSKTILFLPNQAVFGAQGRKEKGELIERGGGNFKASKTKLSIHFFTVG
jgi:D-lyxose ketol-isomerase